MRQEIAADTRCVLGEGPIWHPTEERLYWVDIVAGVLYRYDPRNEEYDVALETDTITGVTIQEDGALLTFHEGGEVGRYADGRLTARTVLVPAASNTRFNDVIATPEGRVFCGTMPTEDKGGDLFRLDPDGSVTRVERDIAIPNGMAFSDDTETFYFTETEANAIYAYEYDRSTGGLSNRRELVDTSETDGTPDGVAIDTDGYLWSAQWEGGCVNRYGPDGTLAEQYEVDCQRPTSVCFAGPRRRQLYVTTAGGDDRGRFGVVAGALLNLGDTGTGRASYRSNIPV